MTVKIKTKKVGMRLFFFLVKFRTAREVLKIKECYSTLIYLQCCHTSNLPEFCVYTKDMTAEMALKSAQNTHKRNKIGHFRFCVRVSLSR